MATSKRQRPPEPLERLRKVPRVPASPLNCPVCDVTLRPETITAHYNQEMERVRTPPASYTRRRSDQVGGATNTRRKPSDDKFCSVLRKAKMGLDSVRRRQILFEHGPSADGPGPSPTTTCPVCAVRLAPDEEEAHVASCLGDSERMADSDSESYEEYTWCEVTRVRTTSLLSPEARANIFNGTVMSSEADTSLDVDIEGDDTATYGPPQFSENQIQECVQSDDVDHVDDTTEESGEVTSGPPSSARCLICMSGYSQPLVSVQCWHVYCESCWLQALKAQKLCPKCKRITSAGDLRRIFL